MREFNLSLDDMSPHEKAGLHFESIYWCNKLIEKFPDFKVNLFVPAAYCRLGEEPCFLTKNPDWIDKVNSLPDNYRINLHGYYHRRVSKKYGNSNNDEWQYLKYDQALDVGKNMIEEFEKAGLKYHPTFRPPGWKISGPACQALEKLGVTCFAGNSKYQIKNENFYTAKWVNYDWDMVSPYSGSGRVLAYGHTSSWTNNYFDETRYNLVLDVLNSNDFEFRFLEDIRC